MREKDLPEGWRWASLGDVAEVQLGKMLDRAKHTQGKRLRYLRNANVRWGAFDLSDLSEMYFEEDEVERFSISDGDLFICEGGEPGRAAVWRGPALNLMFQKALLRVRPGPNAYPDWLMYALLLDAAREQLEPYFTGSTIKHFPRQSLLTYEFPLPPIVEQKRIVAKVEELLASVNATRARLARISAILKRFRQAVLETSLSGGLTGSDTASWTSRTLGSLGNWFTGGTPSRKVATYFGGKIPWVKSGDLSDGVVNTTTETLTGEGVRNSAAKVMPAGTISVALYGATIGKLGILDMDAATNQACANCVIDEGVVDVWFLFYFLLGEREELIKAGQGGAQPNLTNQIVRDWPISVPPLPDQREIVRRVEAFFADADGIDTHVAAASARAERITQAILAKAFSGDLVQLALTRRSIR